MNNFVIDKDIFVTKLIENYFSPKKLNITQFCKELDINRGTYYNYLDNYHVEIDQAISKVKRDLRLKSLRQLSNKLDKKCTDKAVEIGLKMSGDLQDNIKINGFQIVIRDQTDEDFEDAGNLKDDE